MVSLSIAPTSAGQLLRPTEIGAARKPTCVHAQQRVTRPLFLTRDFSRAGYSQPVKLKTEDFRENTCDFA